MVSIFIQSSVIPHSVRSLVNVVNSFISLLISSRFSKRLLIKSKLIFSTSGRGGGEGRLIRQYPNIIHTIVHTDFISGVNAFTRTTNRVVRTSNLSKSGLFRSNSLFFKLFTPAHFSAAINALENKKQVNKNIAK